MARLESVWYPLDKHLLHLFESKTSTVTTFKALFMSVDELYVNRIHQHLR